MMGHQDRSSPTYHTPLCQRDESLKHCNVYSGFNDEMRVAVAHPCKLHREVAEFETWRTKIEEVLFSCRRTCKQLRIIKLYVPGK